MVEIATLDISVDSSSVRDATASFGKLTLASRQSEVAVGASLRALKTMNGVAREVGGVIHKAATEVMKLGNSYVSSLIAAHSLNGKMKQLDNHALPKQSRIAPAIVDRKAEQSANKLTTTGSPAYDDVLRAVKEYGQPREPAKLDRFLGDFTKFVRYLTGSGVDGKAVPLANVTADGIDLLRPSQQFERSKSEVRNDHTRISTLNDYLGKNMPELRRDFDEVSEQKKMVDFADGIPEHIGWKYKRAENFMLSFYRGLNDGMESLLQSASVDPEMELHALGVAKESLDKKIRGQTASRSDVENVQRAAVEAIDRTGRQDVRDFLASFNETSGPIIDVLDSIGRFKEESIKVRDKLLATPDSAAQQKSATTARNSVAQASSSTAAPSVIPAPQPGIQDTLSAQFLISNASRLFEGAVAAGAAFTGKAAGTLVDAADLFAKTGIKLEETQQATEALTKSNQINTEQTKLGTQASAQSAAATENVKAKVVTLKQSQDGLQKSGAAQLAQMPQLTKAANDQAAAYRRLAEAQALGKLSGDIQFQREQMGRSTVDQTVASTQKQYGLPVDMNSASAGIIRYNEQLKYARELAGDFASTLVSGLRNGEGLWKSLGKAAISVLTKISDRLLNDVLNSVFKVNSAAAGGGLFGGGGIFGGGGGLDLGILARSPQAASAIASGSAGLFADGGYTGPGGVHDPAGVVHAGEVVWSQKDIARAGGVGVVEAMRLGRRGYADGGAVGEGGSQFARVQPDASVPTHRLKAGNQNEGSGSGVHVTVGVSVDEDGNLKAYVKNVAQSEAQTSTRQGLNDYNQQLPDRVAQINRNPRRR
ncbi:hypothetical protein [Rhizobium sp.]|uniref:hypothetical protein n=1 Tax=Rhizobium sp. TaxID=391 RepID=UPI002EEDE864